MSLAQVLCLVPAERAHLAPAIQKAGAIAVVDFTTSAKSAVPALIELLTDHDAGVRNATTNALKAIDPEAAARAGVK